MSFESSVSGQPVIVFENIFTGKSVMLKTHDQVHLRFTVHDTASTYLDIAISDVTVTGVVEFIDDSTILLL